MLPCPGAGGSSTPDLNSATGHINPGKAAHGLRNPLGPLCRFTGSQRCGRRGRRRLRDGATNCGFGSLPRVTEETGCEPYRVEPRASGAEPAMKALPEGVARYGGTSVFSEGSIPANLRRAHRTKAGTWAKIVVLEGRLRYGDYIESYPMRGNFW